MVKDIIWENFKYNGILYKVSDEGAIVGPRGRQIKQRENSDGYMEVTLGTTSHRNARIKVHRIVATLFCDGYVDGLEVNHKDFNRKNNSAENLEWVSHIENIGKSVQAGHYDGSLRTGEKNGRAKLTYVDAYTIKRAIEHGYSISEIARKMHVGWTTVHHIKNGDTWKEIA